MVILSASFINLAKFKIFGKFAFHHFHIQTEARRENQEAVVEEERKAKLPANFEARQARLESQVAYEHFKIDCASKG